MFEPTYEECEFCPLYRQGDGNNLLSKCLAEEGHEPPEWCPHVDPDEGLELKDEVKERLRRC